jgi:hypothetical protein
MAKAKQKAASRPTSEELKAVDDLLADLRRTVVPTRAAMLDRVNVLKTDLEVMEGQADSFRRNKIPRGWSAVDQHIRAMWERARWVANNSPVALPRLPDEPEVIQSGAGERNALRRLLEWMSLCVGILEASEPEQGPTHGEDFAWVRCHHGEFMFSPDQRKVVEILWTDWQSGGLGVGAGYMLENYGGRAAEIRYLFKDNDAWSKLIIKVAGTRDLYRLDLPPFRR